MPTPPPLRLSEMGDTALLAEVDGPLELSTQAWVWALADAIAGWPSVREAVPGMTNLLVVHDPAIVEAPALVERIQACWNALRPVARAGRTFEIPIRFGGEWGPDLAVVAGRAGLVETEAVAALTATEFTVFALGSSPGFGYLGGLPPPLHTPRRADPIPWAEGRSLLVGGAQIGVTWAAGPTGWWVIGRALVDVFERDRQPPALLAPGDVVRFRASAATP